MKRIKIILASVAIAGMVLTMAPLNAFATRVVPPRLSGDTAEQTAIAIAEQSGPTGTAILASSTSYGMVDALTAGPLANHLSAPILLTGAGNTLDADTKAELTHLGINRIYVTSGTAVISQGVLDELEDMSITVVKLGGVDRAETSVNIAQKMDGVTKVAIANSVQDALSIASIASAAYEPILLTDKDVLPASIAESLALHTGITSSDVIGGTGIISTVVEASVPSATRHAGYTAYDTNSQIIQDFASSLSFDQIYLASGVTGIDALAGAPFAAQTKSAIVLTDGTIPPVADFINTNLTAQSVVTALGGVTVVPAQVLNGIGYNITSTSSSADSNSIVYKSTQYGFNFTLPTSWKGYSIISSKWEGSALGSQQAGDKIVQSGPMVSIRLPQWTTQSPRQDIPILVFTLDEWNSLQQGKFHIGAAPIGPSELSRNSSYVFALPARYNYAFPTGYEEVDKILGNHPLQATPLNADSTDALFFNMMNLSKQGKVINCDFPAKTTTIDDVKKAWGKADQTSYVAAAKGSYATFSSHKVVFGFNKGDQIFEVRSFDSRLGTLTLAKAKEILGDPAYDVKNSSQEIIGYTAGAEFKVEMVFPQPTASNPTPAMDHYSVLYPQGTVNSMANDPGRQW